ncbi:MAG: glycosyltransferase family 39 protein, partial [Candidatus Omnitrophica bacterium]|nr:glycosyltransferase family 39 protein [Candidatus Omnitrophota bacterium]
MSSDRPFFGSSYQHRYAAAVAVIFLVAGLLRIHQINRFDFWFDELASKKFSYPYISAHAAQYSASHLQLFLEKMRPEHNPPLYYLLVYLYSFIFPADQSLRLLSVVLSMAALYYFYRLARFFLDEESTLVATGIMALSPVQLWYAQELRGAVLDCFLACCLGHYFFCALTGEKNFYWYIFGMVALLSLFANPLLLAVVFAGGFFFTEKKIQLQLRKWLWIVFLSFMLIVIGGIFYYSKITDFARHYWLERVNWHDIIATFGIFTAGYSAWTPSMFKFFSYAGIAGAVLGGYFFCRDRRPGCALFLASGIILPIAVMWFFS